jgi:transcriptional regulator with XRE-family HTH domain
LSIVSCQRDDAAGNGTSYRLLGARLQALRKAKRMSLKEVADQVGVSRSFLSLLERGETDLSLTRFSRLAEFYGVHPSDLLLELSRPPLDPDMSSIADARTIDRGAGVEYRLIQEDHPQIVFVRIAPGAAFSDLTAHRGDDVWLVLEGSPTLLYGNHEYPVAAGTRLRFSATLPHGWSNTGKRPAVLVALCTSPYW